MMEEASRTHAGAGHPALGVNLAGYLDAVLGIGEVARRARDALECVGVPVSVQPLSGDGAPTLPGPGSRTEPARHPVNLLCVNAEGMEGAHASLGDAWFSRRYTIGFWWWEVGVFPERWGRAFDLLDELWVGSHHVAEALAPVSPAPVLRMPVPLAPARPIRTVDRPSFGLPAEGPLFVTVFDHSSVLARKNPMAAIRAFREAFPAEEPAALLVKSIGGARHPEQARAVSEAAGDDRRVRILDRELDEARMAELMTGCDCFVSLHRAEGFGLPLAQAMLAGRPAIATAYGGPRDFLHPGNGFPVDYRLVRIGPGNDPYPADGWWAEPDLGHAARCMRDVAADPDGAARRGERASAELSASHSLQAAGQAMAARIELVANLPPRRDGRPGAATTRELLRRIGSEPLPPRAAGTAALRRPLRDVVLRLIRPQTVHQRRVDEEIARLIRTLDERVAGLNASHASVLAELAELRRAVERNR